MPNPLVSLRHDQLIAVNKAENKNEQLEKGLEEEEKKRYVGMLRPVLHSESCVRKLKLAQP
jgi:hypothetical protein